VGSKNTVELDPSVKCKIGEPRDGKIQVIISKEFNSQSRITKGQIVKDIGDLFSVTIKFEDDGPESRTAFNIKESYLDDLEKYIDKSGITRE